MPAAETDQQVRHPLPSPQKAEKILRHFDARGILSTSPEGINILDAHGRIVYQNDASLSHIGDRAEEKGLIFADTSSEDRNSPLAGIFSRKGTHRATVQLNPSQSIQFLEISATSLCDESGEIIGAMEILRDVSEEKILADRMVRAKREWEETFDILNDMITIHDLDYTIIRANHAAETMLGIPLAQILHRKCFASYHGTTSAPANCPSCRTLVTQKESTSEVFEPHLNRYLEIKALPRFDEEKNLIGVVHVARDITVQKDAENKLRHQIGFMKILGEISTRFINLHPEKIDRETDEALAMIGAYVHADRCFVFQLDPEEKFYTNTYEWCAAGIPAREEKMKKIAVTELPWLTEQFKDGKILDTPSLTSLPAEAIREKLYLRQNGVRSFLAAPKIHGNRLVGFVGYDTVRENRQWSDEEQSNLRLLTTILTHALERKRIETVLLESEERFRQMTENIEAVFWIYSPDETRILYVSPAYEKIWGRTCDSLYRDPHSWQEAIHRQDGSRLPPSFRDRRRTDEEIYRIVQPGGEIRWIRDRAFPLRNSSGETYRIVGIAEDITKIKQAEEQLKEQFQQLMHADKMIALGTLVSGVAHEINNPNNFIMLNAPLLRSAWESALPVLDEYSETHDNFMLGGLEYREMREAVFMLINGIKEGSNRIKTIVSDLKDFARKDVGDTYQSVDMNTVVRVATTLVGNLLKNATENFSVSFGKNLPPIHGNAQQLEQVLINLIQNACQALPDKKKAIIVSTEYDNSRHSVLILVRDQGSGIAPEILPAISDPFFTTKRDSGGTGLGLSISARIIREHRGTITFESEPGKGTTATVSLPAVTPEHRE